MRAAERKLYEPRWSRQILEEVSTALKTKRLDLDPTRINRTITRLLAAFPDALVESYEALVPSMKNHPHDRHVLAAAVHTKADVLVTSNTRDFPREAVRPFGIE